MAPMLPAATWRQAELRTSPATLASANRLCHLQRLKITGMASAMVTTRSCSGAVHLDRDTNRLKAGAEVWSSSDTAAASALDSI